MIDNHDSIMVIDVAVAAVGTLQKEGADNRSLLCTRKLLHSRCSPHCSPWYSASYVSMVAHVAKQLIQHAEETRESQCAYKRCVLSGHYIARVCINVCSVC